MKDNKPAIMNENAKFATVRESNDLSGLWIGEELERQVELRNNLNKTYDSLTDKTTSYAKGIKKTSDMRFKIILIIQELK